jgi:hypothetical protein
MTLVKLRAACWLLVCAAAAPALAEGYHRRVDAALLETTLESLEVPSEPPLRASSLARPPI